MKRLALLWLLSCLSLSTQAETIDPRIAKLNPCGQYVVVHINGINTDRDGARENLNEIETAYGNAHDGHIIRYTLAYNRTLGFAQDVIDSYRQIVALYPPLTARDFIQGVVLGIFGSAWLPDIIEGVGQALRSIFRVEEPLLFYEQDLRQIVRDMALVTDQRLLIVGHSQGTLYANMVYDRLTSGFNPSTGTSGTSRLAPEQIGIVAVAAATQSVPRGVHLTSYVDLVVAGVRFAYPATLGPNVELARSQDDRLGHNFRAIYMAQSTSRDAIVREMQYQLNSLVSATPRTLWLPPNYFVIPTYLVAGWQVRTYGGEPVSTYFYNVPGTDGTIEAPGTQQDAIDIAITYAPVCYEMIVEEIRRAILGLPPLHLGALGVRGCSWYPGPTGLRQAGAWWVYSSDGPGEIRARIDPLASGAYIRPEIAATCRGPA